MPDRIFRSIFTPNKNDASTSIQQFKLAVSIKIMKMKKGIIIAILIALLSIGIEAKISQTALSQSSSGQPAKGKTIKLFNGKDLTGWYTFLKERGKNIDPKKVFTVKNGMIRISGEEWGCITTSEEFENYHIVLEFKWGDVNHPPREDKARDSGLLLNSVGEDGASAGIWMHSIECQIIEGGTGDFIVVGDGSDKFQITGTVAAEKQGNTFVFDPKGHNETINEGRINWYGRDSEWKDVLGFRGKNDVEKPRGKWNKLECIVLNGEIIVLLNGKLVNKATNVKPEKGRIQIQSESAEIFFRRVELTPLL